MFCNNCGKKYPRESNVCPYCGEKQTSLAEGNGFFDMISSNPRPESQADFFEKNSNIQQNDETMYLRSALERQSKQIHALKRGQRNMLITCLVLIVLLAALLAINMIYAAGISSKVDALTAPQSEQLTVTPQPETEADARMGEKQNTETKTETKAETQTDKVAGTPSPSPTPENTRTTSENGTSKTRSTTPASKDLSEDDDD